MILLKLFRDFLKNDDGASMPEYALLLGLIAAISIGVLSSMGTNINSIFTNVNSSLSSAASR